METYLVNQLNGDPFEVKNVKSIWETERGVHFNDENDKEQAFVPFVNLANYRIVEDETVEATRINFGGSVEFVKGVLLIDGKTIAQLIYESKSTITIKVPTIQLNDAVKFAELSKGILDTCADSGKYKCGK